MIKRYHREVYFPPDIRDGLFKFTKTLNYKEWKYTEHGLDRLSDEPRSKQIKRLLNSLWLDPEFIFEIYLGKSGIRKACFRLPFDEKEDLIIVVTNNKELVTLYFNDVDDIHSTLDLSTEDYAKE
jgi:hypothetical protein